MKHCFRLFGCYETMDGGELSEALADFSGGVSETIELANTDEAHSDQFHDWLLRASNNRSLMCAAINVSDTFVRKLTQKHQEYLYSESSHFAKAPVLLVAPQREAVPALLCCQHAI